MHLTIGENRMKSTEMYLDEVKERLGLPSDYALAKALQCTRASISGYRSGRTLPDDLVCARIAAALNVEPMEVIAATNYQRSKTDEARTLWESIWGKAAGAIALNLIVCAVGLSVAPSTKAAECGNTVISLSYVKSTTHQPNRHPIS
jgi:transcriptional regulator with XRE-family HTH domain